MPRPRAQSMIAVTSAPDCDRNARSPLSGGACEKLALSPRPGTISPRQFGPWMRRQCGRAASSISCLSSSRTPAVMTTAARVLCAELGDEAGDGGGRRGDDRQVRRGRQGGQRRIARPALDLAVLGIDEPDRSGKAAVDEVRAVITPTLASWTLAPISATDLGASRCSRLRIVMAG